MLDVERAARPYMRAHTRSRTPAERTNRAGAVPLARSLVRDYTAVSHEARLTSRKLACLVFVAASERQTGMLYAVYTLKCPELQVLAR